MRQFIESHQRSMRAMPPIRFFSTAEYARRLSVLQDRMRAAGVDLLIASSPDTMCWLHGMYSRWYRASSPREWAPYACTVVHVDRPSVIHFDYGGERDLIRETSVADDVRFFDSAGWAPATGSQNTEYEFIIDQLRGEQILSGRVALEMRSPVPNRVVSELLESAFRAAGLDIVDGTDLTRAARRLKSAEEIAVIEEAARIGDIGIAELAENLRPGMTELEAWGILVAAMARAGGEHGALHEVVAIGSIDNGHRMSSRRTFSGGDFIIADPCGVIGRYHANVSRTFYLGAAPREAVELSRIAGDAIDVLCDVAHVGTPWADVNARMREYYHRNDIWDYRSWVGGYELGVSVQSDWVGEFTFSIEDEHPEGVVEDGLVTNFESIFHLPMLDTIVYSASGTRSLAGTPHTLIEVN
jgi:Xaa-Pro aminopeptidase